MYSALVAVLALVTGVGALAAAATTARRDRAFLRGSFWRWLAFLGAVAGLAYWIETFGPRINRGPWDIWGNALVAYAMLAGWLIGGMVGFLARRLSQGRDNSA